MIEYRTGDVLQSGAEALVNTVNCVGVMGRGIALQFKKAYPDNFKAYARACKNEEVCPGRMFVYETGKLIPPRLIINFPTKRHWRDKSIMADIEAGLRALVETARARGIKSLAVPLIEKAMLSLPDVRVLVYEPNGAPATEEMAHGESVKMTPGRAAMIGLMRRYLSGLMDPFVTLLEVHKLMYFMQESGQDLQLNFQKAPYGPYADNLRHVLNMVEGHFIKGYGDGGDAPGKHLELLPGATDQADLFLQNDRQTKQRFERVGELVEGFESPFGLELLASAHWVMTRENAHTQERIVAAVHGWNARKRQFSGRQIGLAVKALSDKGWV